MTKKGDSKSSVVDSKSNGAPDSLTDALAEIKRALTAPLNPEQQAWTHVERAADLVLNAPIPPPTKYAAIAAEFSSYAVKVWELRRKLDKGDGLLKEAAVLYRNVLELSRPIAETAPHPPRDVNDLPDVCRRGLSSSGWSGQEIDWLVIRLMQTKQILGLWDGHGATTVAGNLITRLELREGAAPQNEFREKFLRSLPALPEADHA